MLKGSLFNYFKYNWDGGSVGFLKGLLFIYMKYICEGGSVGYEKDRYLSIWSTIVREEA